MKINCNIIQDLLPLYIDDFCSKESSSLVEEHLRECETCSKIYNEQKSEIKVNAEVIKDNLKAKKPFKKITRNFIVSIVLVFILSVMAILTYNTLDGERVGFSTISGRIKSEIFLRHLEKGEFEKAAEKLRFFGAIYEGLTAEEEKSQWINGMKKLKNEGIEIVSHRETVIETDDGFTCGYTTIEIKYNNKLYDFTLGLYTNSEKVELGYLGYSVDPTLSEAEVEIKEMIANKFNEFIRTYYPG